MTEVKMSDSSKAFDGEQQLVVHRPRPDVIVYSGHTFEHIEGLIEHIEALPVEQKYVVQSDVLNAMLQTHNRIDDGIEAFFTYTKKSGAWRLHITDAEFAETWAGADEIAVANERRRDRVGEARANILRNWDTPKGSSWIGRAEHTRTFLASVRPLATSMSFEDAVPYINCAIMGRFLLPSRGVAKTPSPTPGDLARIRSGAVRLFEITPEHLVDNHLRFGPEGILELDDGTAILECARVQSSGGDAGDFAGRAREISMAAIGDLQAGEMQSFTPSAAQSPANHAALPTDCTWPLTSDAAVDIGLIEDAEQDLLEERNEGHRDIERGSDYSVKKRKLSKGGGDVAKCSCSGDVTEGWKKSVMQKRELGLVTDMKLLARMQEFEWICYPHAKAMGGHLGLMVRSLEHQQLMGRMKEIHDNRLQLGRLKTQKETFAWFRVENRPSRPSDMLGPYKFVHENARGFSFDQTRLLERLGVDSKVWQSEGSVNVLVFDWWFKGPIGQIIQKEFEMYRHHLREINGKPNYGWLRNSFYSIGQQLMRQDPVYYALYAALRPDKQWRLVSYPYYAKYAVAGDRTYFRHIDVNVPDLLGSARGSNMIQGSVSIDNETEQDCTVIIAGMHNKLREWWEHCVSRGQETSGFVHRITEQMFTRGDAQKLGVDWKRVPCQQGEVRVTLPHIPHGSDGPCARTRRTMLPWFVGVQEDHEALEVIDGGTWSELSVAHRDLISPKATPSGLANRYGAIPYRFPAAVEVSGLGALSDALVCRRRWDSPAVVEERDMMLCGRVEAVEEYIRKWRERATRVAEEAFELVQREEERVFGKRSFFYHVRRLEKENIPFPEIVEDQEEVDVEGWENEQTMQLRFAEEGMDLEK